MQQRIHHSYDLVKVVQGEIEIKKRSKEPHVVLCKGVPLLEEDAAEDNRDDPLSHRKERQGHLDSLAQALLETADGSIRW